MHKTVSAYWLYLSIFINILMLLKNFSPDVSISASYALNATDPIDVVFGIKNIGYVNIHDVKFNCSILDGTIPIVTLSDVVVFPGGGLPASGQLSVSELASGQTASRNCLDSRLFRLDIKNPATIRVNFSATYTWPLVRVVSTKTEHFSVRSFSDQKKYVLVPDVEN